MSSLVIVAIPEQDDYVWKLSSEKVPHITLLFLGDADTNQHTDQIVQFVEHAAGLMRPFYMDVDYRGPLGDDEADVLFFEKGWDFKHVAAFREQLLGNAFIKAAYNEAEQFPEWTPHLTLGYPATPAHTPKDEYRPYSVHFNRIAVWLGDSEGPEFRLKHPERGLDSYDAPLAMGERMSANDARELLHFGVKGMKWGVVKEKAKAGAKALGRGLSIATVAIADSHWQGHVYSEEGQAKVHNATSERLNGPDGALAKLTAAPKYRGKNLEADHALRTQYQQDVAKVTDRAHQLAVRDVHGTNYSETKKAVYVNDAAGPRVEIHDVVKIKHADSEMIVIRFKQDENGLFTEANTATVRKNPAVLKQGEDFTEGVLHSGVKGMKWGVRKDKPNTLKVAKDGSVMVTTNVTKKGKAKVETHGGTHAPAHDDAIRAAVLKAKTDGSGLNALSNKELQDLTTRMNLEAQVNKLNPPQVSRGRLVVQALFGSPQKQAQTVKMAQEGQKIVKKVKEAQAQKR